MLDSLTIPQWQFRILEQLLAADFTDLRLVLRNSGAADTVARVDPWPLTGSDGSRDQAAHPSLLFRCYEALDRRRFAPQAAQDPSHPVDACALLASVDRIDLAPIGAQPDQRFAAADVARVRAGEIDVLLRWGFDGIRGEILSSARYGVWSYHHGDDDFQRTGPPGFWELYERRPLTGVTLEVQSGDPGGRRVLQMALVSTQRGISLQRNRLEPYWIGVPFVIRKLWELHAFGWEFVRARAIESGVRRTAESHRGPTNLETARFVVREVAKVAAGKVRRRLSQTTSHWRIALRRSGRGIDPEGDGSDATGFTWIASPKGRSYADPFLASHAGRDWLFFEDLDYRTDLGRINCAEIAPDGTLGAVEPVLELPCHLSYPLVFAEGGEHYMIPEQGSTGRVDLYHARDFPRGWTRVSTLFEGATFVDVTLLRHEGRFWFFATAPGIHGARYELYLFFADSLTGKWHYHPANPVSLDIVNARSAGSIFEHRGRLIRPFQDCSVRYGGAVGFEAIVRLDPTEYRVQRLGGIRPGALPAGGNRLDGVHTYNRCNGIDVIDGIREEPLSRVR